jgi:hypothetical protein
MIIITNERSLIVSLRNYHNVNFNKENNTKKIWMPKGIIAISSFSISF